MEKFLGISFLICILLSLFAGCLATGTGVDYSAVAGDMNAAAKNISQVDLTIVDQKAISDMRSQVETSQRHLDSALARIDAAPPAGTAQEASTRQNTRNVLLGFSEYNQVMLSFCDLFEHLLPLMNLDPDQFGDARNSISACDEHMDAILMHLESGGSHLDSVDSAALPPEITRATEQLCLKYAGKKSLPETVERFEAFRSMDYLLKSMDYLFAGVEYLQKKDYRLAEQKFLTARDYLILTEVYGGSDYSSVVELREVTDDLLSKRIFSTVSGQVEQVYITDPLDSTKQVLLHDAVVKAGY